MAAKGIIFTTVGSLAIGGATTSSYYGATKKTILDELKKEILLSDDKQDWKDLLTTKQSIINSEIDNEGLLRRLKDKKDEEELEKWCKESYSQNYYTIFGQHPQKEKLKELTGKICSIKIKEKLKDTNILKENEKSTDNWKKILESIDSYSESNLNTDLVKIKNEKNNENKKDLLYKWCISKYENSYQNNKQKDWNLISKFCVKTSIS